ncbi:hypothetical protein FS837_003596, partial [Tulasnella sp. UAMH 9824]
KAVTPDVGGKSARRTYCLGQRYFVSNPRIMSRTNLCLLLSYLLILSTLAVVHAAPSPPTTLSSLVSPQRRADSDPQSCGFDGDNNTYGLGIRLGVYIQWFCTALCNFLGPSKEEEAKNMRGINLCFQASVTGGLLYITITGGRSQGAGQLYAAEVWIMLYLCLGGYLMSGFEYERNTPNIQGVFQHFLNTLWGSYAIWFIFTGMDQMAHPPCSHYSFFWTKVDMYHWSRVVYKILLIIIAVVSTLGLLYSLISLCYPALLMRFRNNSREPRVPDQRQRLILLIVPWQLLGFLVATTELTIRWNHIHNVNSIGETGQLLPLIVACLTFAPLVYKVFAERLNKAKTSSSSESPDVSELH